MTENVRVMGWVIYDLISQCPVTTKDGFAKIYPYFESAKQAKAGMKGSGKRNHPHFNHYQIIPINEQKEEPEPPQREPDLSEAWGWKWSSET